MSEKILFCDLDGTIISGGQPLSDCNLRTLQSLRHAGVVVALASGRSLYSMHKVISPDMPFDYAIFSTGVGIMHWGRQEIIWRKELSAAEVKKAASVFEEEQVDYMIQEKLPENHKFSYRCFSAHEQDNSDFFRRLKIYDTHCQVLTEPVFKQGASQLLAVLKQNDAKYEKLLSKLQDFSVVRATSPLDGKSIWLEVFAQGVSKSAAAQWLSERGKGNMATYALGNDHNDLDLLSWAGKSLIAKNSPAELKSRFQVLEAEPENFLRLAVETWGLINLKKTQPPHRL
ncbi:MAG: HAD family phosphatase [Oligosphaeraceae bacterium]|nr:HAD family phosphatase [Oligosphaeraceae bacterium]